jgi:TorA maturation chaperone TorD
MMTRMEAIAGPAEFAGTCRLIALLLGEPDGDSAEVVRELAEINPWLEAAAGEAAALPLDQWQGEHTRLFVCGYPKTVCPPFESHYRHGCLNGPAAQEVEDIYRRAGLEPMDGTPADYLGTMLECAAWLAERTGGQCGLLAELWVEHLDLWAGRFAGELRQNARLELYRALGARLEEILRLGE